MAGPKATYLKHKQYYMAWETSRDLQCLCEGDLHVGELAFLIRNGGFSGSLYNFIFFLRRQLLFFINNPYSSTSVTGCCSLISSIQLDIDDWEFTQVVLTAIEVDIFSGLVFVPQLPSFYLASRSIGKTASID
jgi:hypothetical protein